MVNSILRKNGKQRRENSELSRRTMLANASGVLDKQYLEIDLREPQATIGNRMVI